MEKQVITTTSAPGAVGPYVQATKLENIIYCSGQLGINPAEGKLAATVEEQAHCSMKNLGAILREAGSDYSKILKTTIFLTNMDDFSTVNEVYQSYFDGQYPARSSVPLRKQTPTLYLSTVFLAVSLSGTGKTKSKRNRRDRMHPIAPVSLLLCTLVRNYQDMAHPFPTCIQIGIASHRILFHSMFYAQYKLCFDGYSPRTKGQNLVLLPRIPFYFLPPYLNCPSPARNMNLIFRFLLHLRILPCLRIFSSKVQGHHNPFERIVPQKPVGSILQYHFIMMDGLA